MKPLPSIRQRLAYALLGISLAWGLAVTAAVWLAVQRSVDELLDNTLQESAEILFGLLSFNTDHLPLHGGESLPAPLHEEHLVWQIVNAQHQVLLRSHQAPTQALLAHQRPGFSSIGEDWRVYAMPFDGSGRMLFVAQRGLSRREAGVAAAALSVGAALVVGLLCAYWLRCRLRRELEPISTMSASVAHFDPLRDNSTLADATRAELEPMHDAISDLGSRLAKHVANERAFSAHAAHALRTPLAGVVAQLAVAQRKSPPEAQAQLGRARAAAAGLQRVVSALLTLFRSGAELQWQSIQVDTLVAQLGFDTLPVSADATEPVQADPDLLAAALMNLLDNSLRHGATAVSVQARSEVGGTCISVSDDGPGIPELRRAQLQAALDAQNYEGQTGLGLMLANMVARAHGGRLFLAPASSGCTVEMHLGLPPAPQD